jgi:hypothetical protein
MTKSLFRTVKKLGKKILVCKFFTDDAMSRQRYLSTDGELAKGPFATDDCQKKYRRYQKSISQQQRIVA